MIDSKYIVKALAEVIEGVKAARAAGITCLLPDVVAFDDEGGVYFEVPLQDETDVALSLMEREALKANFSYSHKGN